MKMFFARHIQLGPDIDINFIICDAKKRGLGSELVNIKGVLCHMSSELISMNIGNCLKDWERTEYELHEQYKWAFEDYYPPLADNPDILDSDQREKLVSGKLYK